MMRPTAEFPSRVPILVAVGALVVFGLYVRVWGLWEFFLTPDEALVLQISSQPRILDVLIAASFHPHPPLRYLVLHSLVFLSDSPLFLRSFSLLPGVALIPLFFLLGRRTAGAASGIVMATMVAFSPAAMMLSEVLRTYMLGTFFVTAGLYAFFSYLEDRRSTFLYLYGASMALGLLSHYFAVLPMAAVSIVWMGWALRSQRPLGEANRAVSANLPCAVLTATSYVLHLSSRSGPHWWNNIEQSHLASQFPDTVSDFLVHGYELLAYLFSPDAWWLGALIPVGVAVLWRTRHRAVVMVIVVTVSVNLVLTLAEKYPFGGTRQSIFLLPLASIPVGAAIQYGWDQARSWFRGTADSERVRWFSARRRAVSVVTLTCFVACLALVSRGIAREDFLRHSDGPGRGELPVTQDDVTEVVEYLREHIGPRDIILADRQTSLYARLALGLGPEGIAGTDSRLNFRGLEVFYSNQDFRYFFDSDDVLWRSLEDLLGHHRISGDTTIWVLSIGWQPVREVVAGQGEDNLVIDSCSRGGASVYAFKGSEVAAEVGRRFGSVRPEPRKSGATPPSALTDLSFMNTLC